MKTTPLDSIGRKTSTFKLEPSDEHLVSLLSPYSYEAEQFKQIRYGVEKMHQDSGRQVVGVTSPSSGDGKSLVAANLAGALAQSPDTQVLLVEADLRRPCLNHLMGTNDEKHAGVVDFVLESNRTLADVVLNGDGSSLSVVLSGSQTQSPYEVLRSNRFQKLLNDARDHYDFVIVDTPPALFCPDCHLIKDRVDGFILVVRANKTPRKLVDSALNELGEEKILGVVFNTYQHLARYSVYYSSHYSEVRQSDGADRTERNDNSTEQD